MAVYAAGVAFYVWTNYYDAPEYKAAQAWAKAWAVLGEDEGRSCSEAALNRGFDLLLETAALVPDRRDPVDELESLRSTIHRLFVDPARGQPGEQGAEDIQRFHRALV